MSSVLFSHSFTLKQQTWANVSDIKKHSSLSQETFTRMKFSVKIEKGFMRLTDGFFFLLCSNCQLIAITIYWPSRWKSYKTFFIVKKPQNKLECLFLLEPLKLSLILAGKFKIKVNCYKLGEIYTAHKCQTRLKLHSTKHVSLVVGHVIGKVL